MAPIDFSAKHIRLATAVTAAGVFLTSCGGAARDPQAAGPPKPGGTLSLGIALDPACVDPQQVALNAGLNVGRQLTDSLTDQDPKTGAITPWLATSWEVSPDARSFTFHLRDGATFSDGSTVDAEAVKANFEGIIKLGAKAPLGSGYLAGTKEITAVDPHTVRVEFTAPNVQFLQASSTVSLGLLSPKSVVTPPEQRCQGAGLVGSGPFVFERYQPSTEVVITKRRDYTWGSTLFSRPGEAYLDRIVYKIIPEAGVRTGALVSGQLSAISDVQPNDEPQFAPGSGFTQHVRANPGVVFNLQPNTSNPLFSDTTVRQAISKAINRQELVDTVLSPSYKPGTSVLAATTPGYTDLSASLRHDPDGARKLLDQAGWAPGPDGIRVRDGQRLSFEVPYSASLAFNRSALELVQQQLKKVGVEASIKLLSPTESTQIQNTGAYDVLFYNVTRAEPDILRGQFSSQSRNLSKIQPGSGPDELLTQQESEPDPAKRKELVAAAQRVIVEQAYGIPLFELTQVLAAAPSVHGLTYEASSRLQFHDTWLAN